MTTTERYKPRWNRVDMLIGVALAVATIAGFYGVLRNEFINYDDTDYILDNLHVQAGFSRESIVWAFTTVHSANWHPLTWLSHMADCSLYGLDPWGHHLTSLALHVINSVLLFLALRALTGTRWRAALVAALFALHPLHVESVAWAAERKDTLSTLFWMLTLLAYAWYAARRSVLRYVAVCVALVLGLLAKPMLVTLPCALLLLDFWPLARYRANGGVPAKAGWGATLLEKLPLFVLVAVSSFVTLYAQKHGGAMPTLEELPVPYRVANAVTSYALYIGKMFYPVNLAVYYPHASKHTSLAHAAGAAAPLLAITLAAVLTVRRRPYLLMGWLWYLGTLFPVIGIVQVGGQALADRYTYIPLIGLFIMMAWGIADLAGDRRAARVAISGVAVAALVALALLTRREVGYWRDTETLFTRATEVTVDNVAAHDALGLVASARHDYAAAEYHFTESMRIAPSRTEPISNYGVALAEQERYDEAIAMYRRVLEIDPASASAHNNWGNALYHQGKTEEAIVHYAEALRLEPEYADALNSMGAALIAQAKPSEAVAYLTKAVAFAPRDAQYRLNLAVATDILGDTPEAIRLAKEALSLDPHFTKAVDFLKTLHVEP